MATGGVEVDCRFTCSICLELYDRRRGREAKLLPCFHTFCLPCLVKLASGRDSTQTFGVPAAEDAEGDKGEEEEEGRSPCSVTCPTCRRVSPVPPAGVSGFQRNFYLDNSGGEEDPQPVPCTLCDGDHTAQVHCGQCQNNVCSQCRRSHDKCCKGGQVRALQDSSDSSSSAAQKPPHGQVRQQQQLQRVEEAVKKLGEEERKLKQGREAMDHSINVRYATLLRHAADARDVCCRSLGEACDSMTERLHSSMAEARHAQATLQRQLSPSQPAPVATAQQRAALFLQGELQMILDRDLDTCSLLHHHTEDNPSLVTSTLQSFMGSIVKSSQASGLAQKKKPAGSLPLQDGDGALSSAGADLNNLNGLLKKVEDLAGQVSSLQSTNTQLAQHVTLLSTSNSKLATDHSSLQREVATLKDNNATLTTQQAALQRGVTAMRDKHAIVHQDLAVLTTEKDKVCAQLTNLQTGMTSVQTDLTSVQTGMTSVQTDLTSVQTGMTSVQSDTPRQQTGILQWKADHGDIMDKLSDVQTVITALQGDQSSMKKDITALQGDQSSMKKDITALQGDQSSMKKDMTALQREQSSMKKDVTFLQGDQDSMKKDMTALQRDQSSMKKDMTALQRDQSSMKKGIDQMKTSGGKLKSDMQMAQRKLTSLESRFTTANTQVGFHAWLGEAVTTSQKQILTCDLLFSNEGGGYDKDKGVFTAPLTGIYCFLATTSPNEPDVDKKARLDIVVDDVRKGYMFAMGNSWSSGHCVVKVRAGQRVWLRTFADGNDYTFGDGGWTFFSGALLQAEV